MNSGNARKDSACVVRRILGVCAWHTQKYVFRSKADEDVVDGFWGLFIPLTSFVTQAQKQKIDAAHGRRSPWGVSGVSLPLATTYQFR